MAPEPVAGKRPPPFAEVEAASGRSSFPVRSARTVISRAIDSIAPFRVHRLDFVLKPCRNAAPAFPGIEIRTLGLRIPRAAFHCVAASVSDKISGSQKSFSNPPGPSATHRSKRIATSSVATGWTASPSSR